MELLINVDNEITDAKGDSYSNDNEHYKKNPLIKSISKPEVVEGLDANQYNRSSILQMADQKKAKKVKFFRNGDKFFKGVIYAINHDKFRCFESLLVELTRVLSDKINLPMGVRYIFALDGTKIKSLDELQHGSGYVCSSQEIYKKLDYDKNETPTWNPKRKEEYLLASTPLTPSLTSKINRIVPLSKDFIKPKLVMIIRNGGKPRKVFRMLLNKKTAHSLDQVFNDITGEIKLDSGAVRKVYAMNCQQVTTLEDFFKGDDLFIAYGLEKISVDDFELDPEELKNINALMKTPPSSRRKIIGTKRFSHSASSSGWEPHVHCCRNFQLCETFNSGLHSDILLRYKKMVEKKYQLGNIIGTGNFAIVHECHSKESQEAYAMKIISHHQCNSSQMQLSAMIANEISVLKHLKHPNIVRLIEELKHPHAVILVLELVPGGDLFDAISRYGHFAEKDAIRLIADLAAALVYLHGRNIVHRDIKPENLLVTSVLECEHIKLGDFGLAQVVVEPLFSVCGTPTYVAPEILAEVGYGLAVDVWAMGIILYLLLCGFPPFVSETNNQEELFESILRGSFNFPTPYWDGISNEVQTMICKMLQADPKLRCDAQEIYSHSCMQVNIRHGSASIKKIFLATTFQIIVIGEKCEY